MYLIEGLEGGRFAILSKSHQILVDGVATIDLGQVILDVDTGDPRQRARRLAPHHVPSASSLVRDAVRDSVRDPRQALATLSGNAGSVFRTASAVGGKVVEVGGRAVQPPRGAGVPAQHHAVRSSAGS